MGGAKTVNAQQYISQRDPARDVAIAMAMQQAQQQQIANQAEMLKQYSQIAPKPQTYDVLAQSRRAAQLGLQNILQQRELERITSPEAAAMRLQQSKQIEQLTSPESERAYMQEYMRRQALPEKYATGLEDSTIGRAAMYDKALAARQAYQENIDAQRRAYLASTQAPVGGISPETSIAAQQAAQAQNLAAQEAYRQSMFGNVEQLGQMASQSGMQQFANLGGLQQAQQQSNQAYQQAMLQNQAQNLAAQREMTSALIGAGGNVASSAISAAAGAYGGGAGKSITGFGGQQYAPKTSATGGQYYAPVSGSIF